MSTNQIWIFLGKKVESSEFKLGHTTLTEFYTDASAYAGGLFITQFQSPAKVDTTSKNGETVEVPIVYDSFTFPATGRKYPTYKRELYAVVYFLNKYDYLCKHPYHPAIVHTDHKPLRYLLSS